jgi:hypothetical protein
MKKAEKPRVVQLNRETLRYLDSGELPRVVGGTVQQSLCSVCFTVCQSTCR